MRVDLEWVWGTNSLLSGLGGTGTGCQRSCGCPIPVQVQVEQGFEQFGLEGCVPAQRKKCV